MELHKYSIPFVASRYDGGGVGRACIGLYVLRVEARRGRLNEDSLLDTIGTIWVMSGLEEIQGLERF
jgi:hypothetical protein